MVLNVLIVDDSKLARMAIIKALKTLQPEGQRAEAANAEVALASIKQGAFDLVLLDYNMPGKDGLALAAEIREWDSRINIALISANHQVEIINRAKAAGASFLPKPINEKALAELLKTVIKNPIGAV